MTQYYSIGQHHKKSHLDKDEIVPLEQVENKRIIPLGDVENNGSGGGSDYSSSSSADITFHNLEQLAGLRNIDDTASSTNGVATSGLHNKKSGDPPIPAPTPPPTPEQLADLRNVDSAASSTNGIATSGLHNKNSFADHNNRRPTPPPTPAVLFGLRDVHQSSSTKGGSSAISSHQKYSEEKDAINPKGMRPEDYSWEETAPALEVPAPSPTKGSTPAPTADIRRVNPAPNNDGDDGGSGEFIKCQAAEGVYFGNGQTVRNGGVVLRYQYELIQELLDSGDGTGYLVEDILPTLEGGISDALIPVFFEECLNNVVVAEGGRFLQGGGLEVEQQNNMLRHRRLSKVIGIDAKPDDFPLGQQACESDFTSDPYQVTQCHRMEGALTLYFPPNSSLSSLLSSTTLTTLRAIEQGMNDGSLQLSHPAIRKLHFLKDSYEIHPSPGALLPNEDDAASGVLGGNNPEDTENLGLILGIIISLVFVLGCCCCIAGLVLWKRRRNTHDESDDESSLRSETISESKRRMQSERHSSVNSSRNGSVASRRSSRRGDDLEEEGTYAGTDNEYDDYGTAISSDSYDEESSGVYGSSSSQSQYENAASNGDDGDYDSEEEEEERDTASVNPLNPIFEEAAKDRAKRRKAKRRRTRVRRRMERMNSDDDDTSGEGAEEDASVNEDASVMTGATGMHSMSSQATAKVNNNVVLGVGVGVGDDNVSVMTGATGTTRKVSNTTSGGLPNIGEFMSAENR